MTRPTAVGLSLCTALLAAYAALAWSAVRTESPTFDEPYHAASAWVQSHRRDYRIDNEDPPLWQYWASLPNGPDALVADFDGPTWRTMATDVGNQWAWTVRTLYRTPGNDGNRLVGRCRGMMLIVAVGLGVAVAAWAWRLGGPTAAVVATALFALDPNLLAHGPLMKNDVASALTWLGLSWGLWAVGRRATVGTVAALGVIVGVALTVKFSGTLAVAVVPAVLAVRAVLPTPWPTTAGPAASRRRRLLVAAGVTVAVVGMGFASIWAAYGLRYQSGPAPGDHLDLPLLARRAVDNERTARGNPAATADLAVRAAVFADRHHLLPQGYLAGFLFTYGQSLVRPSYLLGRISLTGWAAYFPLAIAFKTPLATLAALALAAGAAAVRVVRRRPAPAALWAAAALGVPPALYLAVAIGSNLNIGLRHVLPIYPPAYVGVGWVVAAVRPCRGWRVLAGGLAVGLAIETFAARPNYLAFFNAPSAAYGRGGFDLLGDSNLDWGQDLIALADWQRRHPGDPLYLSYFGLADPASFGIRARPLPGGYLYDARRPAFPDPAHACWLAVSVTNLQGVALQDARLQPYYARLAARLPTTVLGGSIYLYRYDPADAVRSALRSAGR